MLKTLEEPPEYLKFVLATTDPQKVPVTVLSRCLQFNLRPMAPETVLEHLVQVLTAEGVAADTQALRLLARAARGSMRDALSLTDQAIAFGAGKLEEATVRQMLGSVDRSHVFRLIGALAQGDGRTVVETSEALRLHGLSAASTLEEMASVLQRMAVLQAVPSAVDETDPQALELAQLAQQMPADETQLLYSICLHGRGELGLAPDEYAALTMVLLRLLAFKPSATTINAALAEKKSLTSAPERISVAVAPPPVLPKPVPAPLITVPVKADSERSVSHVITEKSAPPVAPTMQVLAMPVREQGEPGVRTQARTDVNGGVSQSLLVPTEEGDFWHASVQALVAQELITAMVRELALQSQLVGRDTDQWLLRVERESLNQPSSRERLQTALLSLGYPVRLVVEVGRVSDSPAKRNAAALAAKQQAAEESILNDPFVQSMMRDFGAKIVPGSIKSV
jgi:DNA polymerase-3 subunit gamma/tau